MHIASSPGHETGVRFWQAHVRALGAGGLSRCEYCRWHHLSYHALTYWVRKIRQTSGSALPPTLVEVPTWSTLLLRRSGPPFRLHLGPDGLLEIESDFDEARLGRLLEDQQKEARLLPGMVRTDEIVFNAPRLGKNYLRAAQDRDVIAILPNGRRVYEFHPWEKKLAMVGTSICTEVLIYEHLRRTRKNGEHAKDYDTIFYYY